MTILLLKTKPSINDVIKTFERATDSNGRKYRRIASSIRKECSSTPPAQQSVAAQDDARVY